MSLIASDKQRVIVGVGQTGLSVARYLRARGLSFVACDTRSFGEALDRFRAEFPEIELRTGDLDGEFLSSAGEIILSPGVAKDQPAIVQAVAAGSHLMGDIDLFAREISAPVVAITGSNGKSTVTALVGEMARKAGRAVAVGGNIGVPVLDLLAEPARDLYVLELSSFQLETMSELKPRSATVLNLSSDHMDRYSGMPAYHQAKHRIYRGCQNAIFNREDPLSRPLVGREVHTISFGLSAPDLGQYGTLQRDGERWLARGSDALMPVSAMKMRGQHNVLNALAALALGESVGLDLQAMLETLTQFPGLAHRCQWLRELNGVNWYNDSKGTNVGATLAAIEGLGATLASDQKIVLIAGGQGKQQQFEPLKSAIEQHIKALILFGEDAEQIDRAVQFESTHKVDSLEAAVTHAAECAQPGDLVLLSPACASFDMFKSYTERGERFADLVRGLEC